MRRASTQLTAACAAAAILAWAGGEARTRIGGQTRDGGTFASPGGTTIRMLLDEAALGGGEVEVAEITFPAGVDSGDHVHGSTEIFYVLSGELEHVVNGESTILKPGAIGFVRPPDRVRHKTGPAGARALVIWAPGGEAARITGRWKRIGP